MPSQESEFRRGKSRVLRRPKQWCPSRIIEHCLSTLCNLTVRARQSHMELPELLRPELRVFDIGNHWQFMSTRKSWEEQITIRTCTEHETIGIERLSSALEEAFPLQELKGEVDLPTRTSPEAEVMRYHERTLRSPRIGSCLQSGSS